jgi:hypothetical protein
VRAQARAALAAALLAIVVYLPSLRNGFALDDTPVIEENPRAHSVRAALAAFDEPWWPPPHDAGLWRPLTIVSFAADWELSGGSATWLHAGNVLWHATATGLVVPLLVPLVGPAGALLGAMVFAVHPVHVEAVANLVGRAELMAAVFVMLALLAARRARAAREVGAASLPAEAGVAVAALAALFSKEHAVVLIALLALDEAVLGRAGARLPPRTWVAVTLLIVLWFMARRAVDAGQSFGAVAPTFFGLDTVGRLSTMMPVVFEVVRLLVWPYALSPDYHPRVVDRLEAPTVPGMAGALLLLALAALAVALWRRNRAASAGLLVTGVAWSPTSNLLFPSGVVLAERTLYLPSLGVAVLAGAAYVALLRRAGSRAALLVATVILAAAALRTLTRIPVWENTRAVVIDGVLTRPESYKVRQAAARVLMKTGHGGQALREYGVAAELYPHDRFLLREAGSAALALGQPRVAVRYLRAAQELDTRDTTTIQLLERALDGVRMRWPAGTSR